MRTEAVQFGGVVLGTGVEKNLFLGEIVTFAGDVCMGERCACVMHFQAGHDDRSQSVMQNMSI